MSENLPQAPSSRVVRRSDFAVICLIVLVVVGVGWRLGDVVDGAGWLGWDAYPTLQSSRAESWSEVAGVATSRLAGEHLPAGFYRPLFALSVAAEQAWLDASPSTSLALNTALFVACLAALWWWIVSCDAGLGGTARPAGWVGLGLLVLHPSLLELLPYLPRRADLMATLFVLLTLGLDRLWLATGRRAVLVTSLVSAALAMASKETALVLPILVVASRWLLPVSSPGVQQPRALVRPLIAYGASVGLLLIPRFVVVRGVGGYPEYVRQLPFSPRVLAATFKEWLLPSAGLESRMPSGVALAILAVALGLALALVARCRTRSPAAPGWLRLTAFAAVWSLCLASIFAVAGRVSPWYLLLVGCGGFLGVGALSVRAWQGLRSGDRKELAWCVPWLVGVALLGASWWPGSLFGGSTVELRVAGQQIAECLAEAESLCRSAQPGASVEVAGCPEVVAGNGRRVAALKPRSIAAWAEMELPGCRVGVGLE